MLRKKEFLICALTFLVSLTVIELLTLAYNWFPYIYGFNVPTVLSWNVALYFMLAKEWTFKKYLVCATAVIVFALPHILFTIVVYSSWFCFGFSVILAAWLFIKAYMLKKNNCSTNREGL